MRIMLLLTLLAAPSWATSFYQRPFPETVEDAPIVVRGKVGMTYSDWGKGLDGTKRIYTFYELAIDEVFKGHASGKTLQMREIGGEKDGIGMQVAGSARFNRDEDVVVFLSERNADGSYDLRGMMMGKFNLRTNDKGEEYLVGPGIGRPGEGGIVHDDEARGQGDTSVQNTWTLTALRKLILDQRDKKVVASMKGVPSPLPALNSGVLNGAKRQNPLLNTQAPQLQPSAEQGEKPAEGFFRPFTLALILAGLLVLARMVGRRKS